MPQITMYTTRFCPYCMRARALLDKKGVSYDDIDINKSASERATMRERSGRTSVPQIFIDDHHVGGCDELHALDAEGKLDPLLGSAAS
ncbi:MAG: glutaredoxin 3 [Gammaproteobacteria bacterium]